MIVGLDWAMSGERLPSWPRPTRTRIRAQEISVGELNQFVYVLKFGFDSLIGNTCRQPVSRQLPHGVGSTGAGGTIAHRTHPTGSQTG